MDLQAYVTQVAPLLGLSVAAEHQAGVVANLELAARIAQRMLDFPLEPADESGNTFVPVAPEDLSSIDVHAAETGVAS